MSSPRQGWLVAHPYLAPIARFEAVVAQALARAPERAARVAHWEAWRPESAAGVPLLRSAAAGVEFLPAAAETLFHLVEALGEAELPAAVAAPVRSFRDRLRAVPGEAARAMEWVAGGAGPEGAPPEAGIVLHLGWAALRRVLRPIVGEAEARGAEGWGRGSCPTCGSLPTMAQLVEGEGEGGRPRRLACGCCGTRWRFRRIGCPFCDSEGQERLAILELEGDVPLRLDVCDGCGGYLKTYTGEGDEEVFLADWPTLHLDVAAAHRGLKRLGASLYDFNDDERRS
jgi:FdhE protein